MNYIDKLIQTCKDLLRLCKQLKNENEQLSRDLLYYKGLYEQERVERLNSQLRS